MSNNLFKRTAATAAAFVAIGSAGAMTLPSVATAATTHQAASQSVHQVLPQHPGYWCYRWPTWRWCPRPFPYPYPYPRPYPRPRPPRGPWPWQPLPEHSEHAGQPGHQPGPPDHGNNHDQPPYPHH
jgi:hypothetical protein